MRIATGRLVETIIAINGILLAYTFLTCMDGKNLYLLYFSQNSKSCITPNENCEGRSMFRNITCTAMLYANRNVFSQIFKQLSVVVTIE